MKIWTNKRTGKKYREGQASHLYKSHYFKNKTTGEKYRTGAHTNISYKKTGLLHRGRQVQIGTLHKGDRYHKRVWDSYKKEGFL